MDSKGLAPESPVESIQSDGETDITHEVWSLSGTTAISSRTQQLLDEAEQEGVFVLGDQSIFTEQPVTRLQDAQHRGVDIVLGTTDEAVRERVQDELPAAEVFVPELEWLSWSSQSDDDTEISRLVLVDRSTSLVSTFHTTPAGGGEQEQAVFGRGFDNDHVTIVRAAPNSRPRQPVVSSVLSLGVGHPRPLCPSHEVARLRVCSLTHVE